MTLGHNGTRYNNFITPIWRFERDFTLDLSALEQAVYFEREKDPQGTKVSNIGGWQSKMKLMEVEAFFPLANYIREKAARVCNDWGLEVQGNQPVLNTMWANINRGTDINFAHRHWGFPIPNFNILSGAFYIRCSQYSGPIRFLDERPSSTFIQLDAFLREYNEFFHRVLAVQPLPGDLLLFPAWIEHKVDQGKEQEDRISISFNLSLPTELMDQYYFSRKEKPQG